MAEEDRILAAASEVESEVRPFAARSALPASKPQFNGIALRKSLRLPAATGPGAEPRN